MQGNKNQIFIIMKRFASIFFLLSFAFVTITSCTDETEEPTLTNYEKIEGTWLIESQSLFGSDFPGDGSSLQFNFCGIDTPCDGVDYMASDQTTGSFSFEISEDGSTIIIQDDAEDGGNYNGEWTIDEFTSSSLVISIDTGLFGITTIRFTKM